MLASGSQPSMAPDYIGRAPPRTKSVLCSRDILLHFPIDARQYNEGQLYAHQNASYVQLFIGIHNFHYAMQNQLVESATYNTITKNLLFRKQNVFAD